MHVTFDEVLRASLLFSHSLSLCQGNVPPSWSLLQPGTQSEDDLEQSSQLILPE